MFTKVIVNTTCETEFKNKKQLNTYNPNTIMSSNKDLPIATNLISNQFRWAVRVSL
jgi:hypothetical protein